MNCRALQILIAVVLYGPAPLWADAIKLRDGLTYDGLHIDRVEEGQVFYNLNGQDQSKPVTGIVGLSLDDEQDFDAGEAAYELGKWDAAVQGYLTALASTQRPWLKDWIAPRLLDAAGRAGRFDAEVSAWIQMVSQDPTPAVKFRPIVPQTDSTQMAAAALTLNDAAGPAQEPGRRLMLGLLLDVQLARQDWADADVVAKELDLDRVNSSTPADAAQQRIQVSLARLALEEKDYDKAAAIINAAAPILTDPQQQAEALFAKAQALEGIAAKRGLADDWKDAALAYLRVYVHFPTGVGSEHSAEALLAAARIEEVDLHEPRAALTLYQKARSQYGQSPMAAEAAQAVNRLRAAGLASEPTNDSGK
jgi:tetratricopeptide (TPR) repeat protein